MRPIIFTQEETNYLVSSIDMRMRKAEEGLAEAQIGLGAVRKFQEAIEPSTTLTPVPDSSAEFDSSA